MIFKMSKGKSIVIIISLIAITTAILMVILFFYLYQIFNMARQPDVTYALANPSDFVDFPSVDFDHDYSIAVMQADTDISHDIYSDQTYTYKPARIVNPTTIILQVNENSVEVAANNIDGSNYFRLYDIEYALRATNKQFDPAKIETYLTGYTVNGYKYFSIREIAEFLDFRIAWIGTRNTVIIDTSINYTISEFDEPIFTMEPLPEYILQVIRGSSFHDNTPFSYCFLTYLTITHVDLYGRYRLGNMIVAAEIGEEVLDIFREIFEYRFPIHRMRLIDFYNAGDYLSMADNNSVAFNFRYIAGTGTLSRHALGMAIDINPIQNPYIRGNTIWPLAGAEYLDRTNIRPGMITRGDAVYRAFISRGWIWGGNWQSPRDYHHFERHP
ncbi:MAG: M15 family metallopeptidase [Defluviitaleaceae bacterium]|nr:M15 family metallopeptidase [Defluviitaleaceae bacterium]